MNKITKVLCLVSALYMCTNMVAAKDKPWLPLAYFPDEVMRYTSIECWNNQTIDPKPQGFTRIAVVGDGTTVGVGSSRSLLEFSYD